MIFQDPVTGLASYKVTLSKTVPKSFYCVQRLIVTNLCNIASLKTDGCP